VDETITFHDHGRRLGKLIRPRSKQDETGGRGRADKTHHSVPRVFHDRAVWRTSLAMLVTKPAVARDGPERG
jgi:hypothetical protein